MGCSGIPNTNLMKYPTQNAAETDSQAGMPLDIDCGSQAYCIGFRKAYRRDATVFYPNVDIDKFTLGQDGDFYLTASRLAEQNAGL